MKIYLGLTFNFMSSVTLRSSKWKPLFSHFIPSLYSYSQSLHSRQRPLQFPKLNMKFLLPLSWHLSLFLQTEALQFRMTVAKLINSSLLNSSGQTTNQDIRHLHGDRDGLRPCWDISLQVGERRKPNVGNWDQTQSWFYVALNEIMGLNSEVGCRFCRL